MSLVKVVPSNGVAEGYMDVPISSAPTGKLGLQMLPDEQVLWEGTFQAFAKGKLVTFTGPGSLQSTTRVVSRTLPICTHTRWMSSLYS